MLRESSGNPMPIQRTFDANPADIKRNSNVVLTRFQRESSTADEKDLHAFVQALMKWLKLLKGNLFPLWKTAADAAFRSAPSWAYKPRMRSRAPRPPRVSHRSTDR